MEKMTVLSHPQMEAIGAIRCLKLLQSSLASVQQAEGLPKKRDDGMIMMILVRPSEVLQ